jgi:hypothetical protein
VIFQDAVSEKSVTVFPKGLDPRRNYIVAWRFGRGSLKATGKKLMTQGIRFTSTKRGEAILLNLPFAPGKGADTQPPTPPTQATKERASFWGHDGMAIQWQASADNVMVAGYRVYRNKKLLDQVAIGTFYFDCGRGNSLAAEYTVVAVDGDGNCSRAVRVMSKEV